jgi:hypothetical protein
MLSWKALDKRSTKQHIWPSELIFRRMKPWLDSPRPILAVVALIGYFGQSHCTAQSGEIYAYRIQFTSEITDARSKFVQEALRDQDPDPLTWFESGSRVLFAYVHAPLDVSALGQAIVPSGLGIAHSGPIDEGVPIGGSASSSSMPEQLDTGDPVRDALRYELAKRGWIAEHSNAYHQVLTTQPVQ